MTLTRGTVTHDEKKVVVAMSGGVDSSVTAALLKDQGYEVVGCFMRLGHSEPTDPSSPDTCRPGTDRPPTPSRRQGCCSVNDASDARLVAAILDIPFYVLNFQKDFGRIIRYFVGEYNAGRTPNPCVRCNDWLKFGKLSAYARSIGAGWVATGHYARIDHRPDQPHAPRLLRGRDTAKDQSYVLFGTPHHQLRRTLLPIGDLDKPQVRRIALERGLPVHDKPDSQEICFVPDNDYPRLIQRHSPDAMAPGNVVDRRGRVVGHHQGHQRFTIGQRRGLGLSLSLPVYVVDKDPHANTVTVADKRHLDASALHAHQTNWLIPPPTDHPIRCQVKVRYNSPPVHATVHVTTGDSLTVQFDQPQAAVTPGQAAVCYQGDHLIGGGWIDRVDHQE